MDTKEQMFLKGTITREEVQWETFEKLVSETRGAWKYFSVRQAFFNRLLELGVLSVYPDQNCEIKTSDNYGCNPFVHGRHLYFRQASDALAYGRALYKDRGNVYVFRLEPAGNFKV